MSALLLFLLAVPFAGALVALTAASRVLVERIAGTASAIALVLALATAIEVAGSGPILSLGGLLRADALSALALVLTAFIQLAVLLASAWDRGEAERRGELDLVAIRRYHAAALGLAGAAALTFLAGHLALLWLALALAAVAAAGLLAGLPTARARSAAWSLAVQAAAALAVALVGLALLEAAEPARAPGWSAAPTLATGSAEASLVQLGSLLFLLGAASLIGLSPLHLWLEPAHVELPPAAGALLSTTLVGTAIYPMLRLEPWLAAAMPPATVARLFGTLAVLTLAAAAASAAAARGLRSLLAASTLAFVGLITLAIGLGEPALPAALALALGHGLAKTLAFLAAGDIRRYFGDDAFARIGGALSARTFATGMLLFALFSLALLPPAGLFQASVLILRAGFAAGHPLLTGAALLLLFAVAASLLGVARVLSAIPERASAPRSRRGSPLAAAVMSCLALLLLALGLFGPGPLADLARSAALPSQASPPAAEPAPGTAATTALSTPVSAQATSEPAASPSLEVAPVHTPPPSLAPLANTSPSGLATPTDSPGER